MRSEIIEGTVSFALAMSIMAAASNRVGRLAVEERSTISRASSSLPVAIGLSRALYNDFGVKQCSLTP